MATRAHWTAARWTVVFLEYAVVPVVGAATMATLAALRDRVTGESRRLCALGVLCAARAASSAWWSPATAAIAYAWACRHHPARTAVHPTRADGDAV